MFVKMFVKNICFDNINDNKGEPNFASLAQDLEYFLYHIKLFYLKGSRKIWFLMIWAH